MTFGEQSKQNQNKIGDDGNTSRHLIISQSGTREEKRHHDSHIMTSTGGYVQARDTYDVIMTR